MNKYSLILFIFLFQSFANAEVRIEKSILESESGLSCHGLLFAYARPFKGGSSTSIIFQKGYITGLAHGFSMQGGEFVITFGEIDRSIDDIMSFSLQVLAFCIQDSTLNTKNIIIDLLNKNVEPFSRGKALQILDLHASELERLYSTKSKQIHEANKGELAL